MTDIYLKLRFVDAIAGIIRGSNVKRHVRATLVFRGSPRWFSGRRAVIIDIPAKHPAGSHHVADPLLFADRGRVRVRSRGLRPGRRAFRQTEEGRDRRLHESRNLERPRCRNRDGDRGRTAPRSEAQDHRRSAEQDHEARPQGTPVRSEGRTLEGEADRNLLAGANELRPIHAARRRPAGRRKLAHRHPQRRTHGRERRGTRGQSHGLRDRRGTGAARSRGHAAVQGRPLGEHPWLGADRPGPRGVDASRRREREAVQHVQVAGPRRGSWRSRKARRSHRGRLGQRSPGRRLAFHEPHGLPRVRPRLGELRQVHVVVAAR